MVHIDTYRVTPGHRFGRGWQAEAVFWPELDAVRAWTRSGAERKMLRRMQKAALL
ncbi:hypothetical protein [uncultured Friedmanniella sp.]|uniref:hypothetical protein n=1 Tax=uncultured Friedmanniella sp. TaxID=335381 RepID=UPI0035CB2CF9